MWTAKNGLGSSPKLCSLRSKLSISVSMKFLFPVMQPFLLLISKQLADYVAMVALAIDGYFFSKLQWRHFESVGLGGGSSFIFCWRVGAERIGNAVHEVGRLFFQTSYGFVTAVDYLLRVGASGDKNCNSSKTGSCWCCQWSIGVGAGNFVGMQRTFCPDLPKYARKTYLYKLSPTNFLKVEKICWTKVCTIGTLHSVGTLHFPQPCCHTYFTFQMED